MSSLKEKRLFKNIPEEESKTNKLKTDFNASLRCEISNDSKKRNSDGNFSRLNLTPSNQNIFNDNLEDNLSTVTNDFKVDCCFEEELYVKGRTVIWSKGKLTILNL